MQIIRGISQFRKACRDRHVLSLGNFDGVHLGHRAILQATVSAAKALAARTSALIFTPHPMQVLAPERFPALLITTEDRIALLGAAGIDYIVVEQFTREFAATDAETFARGVLKETLNVSGVVIGFDYTFGCHGSGSSADMQRFGEMLRFRVDVISPVTVNNVPASSSRIRALLSAGKVEEAAEMLGYPFYLRGRVVRGDGRGRQLGFPTANLQIPPDLVQPGHGVYLSRVLLAGRSFWGVTNVGNRPTFCRGEPTMEVHLLDTEEDIYGRELTVYFLRKIRDEEVFAGSAQLQEQISRDLDCARRLIP
jgi:riboflavin kinase/FMN adenylyltransferase